MDTHSFSFVEKSRTVYDLSFETRPPPAKVLLHRIGVRELREAIETGGIIEDYPDDKYGPNCLIFGLTTGNRPLHVQVQLSVASVAESHHALRAG